MDGVYVLPSGPIASNPGELLSSEEMAFVLRRARRWADVVLLDAPPVLSAADSSILGAYADAVVLVLAAGRTNRAQATEAKDQLVAAGAQVLGVVLIGSDESARGDRGNDLDISLGGGAFGGWDAYESSSYGQWYEEPVTASARMEPRAPARSRAPRKKTAAAAPGQRPARQKEPAVPRNARTRTSSGQSSRGGSAARRSTTKKTTPARKTTAQPKAARRRSIRTDLY
jgi:hypothetical protein